MYLYPVHLQLQELKHRPWNWNGPRAESAVLDPDNLEWDCHFVNVIELEKRPKNPEIDRGRLQLRITKYERVLVRLR